MIVLLSLIFYLVTITTASINGLTTITECLCPGYSVIYECTVTGGIFTVWGGSAFQCAGGDITLSNSEFGAVPPPAAVCNNGQIIGHGISQQSNCYTSQLNVTLSEELVGRTVTCGIDDGRQYIITDSTVLTTSNRPLSSPKNITMNITPNSITFTWEHVSQDCPGLYYNISSINCGTCPSKTNMSMITCSDFIIQTNCTLIIQPVTCWGTNIAVSGSSTSLLLFLKVPEAPDLFVIPYYNEREELIGVYTNFSKNEFMITDSVDGSPIFYNITYTDFTGRTTCGLATIFTNSCNKTCSHYSSDICLLTDTVVTVFGTNVLGSGASNKATIDHQNDFVKTKFDLTTSSKRVKCTFREQTSDVSGPIMCRISIASGSNCQSSLRESEVGTGSSMAGETVTINIDDLISNMDDGKDLCYTITASNGTKQVVVQDIVSIKITDSTTVNGAVVTTVILIIAVAILIIIVIVFLVLQSLRSNVRDISDDCKSKLMERDEEYSMEQCGQELVGPEYDHSLGHGYYRASEHEHIPSSVNVIARSENRKVYKTGSGVHKKFIENGKILSPNRRGSKYEKWSVFIQSRSFDKILKEGDEFVHYKVGINECLQQEGTATLPEGVTAVKQWYYIYDIPQDIQLDIFCKEIGKALPDNQNSNIFYEKHVTKPESETKRHEQSYDQTAAGTPLLETIGTGPGSGNKVMALNNDGKLFEGSRSVLFKDAMFIETEHGRRVLGSAVWKHLFIQSCGTTLIYRRSKLLYCDQKDGPALVCKPFQIYEVTTDDKDKKISDLLKKSHPYVLFELKAGYVYIETEEAIKPQDKLMALDKGRKLCSGPGVHQLLKPVDYEKVWKGVFVQVTSDKSLERCTRILYCKA